MTLDSASSQYFQDLEDGDYQICQLSNESMKCENTDSHNNVQQFQSIAKDSDDSEEEQENVSQMLSVVIEQFENSMASESTSIQSQEDQKTDSVLRGRIKLLEDTMTNLREQFHKELSLLKQERREFDFLKDENDYKVLEETSAAARAAAIAYAAESPVFNEFEDHHLSINNNQNFKDFTPLGMDRCMAQQQNPVSFSPLENKNHTIHRNMLAKAYEQKLAEVEKLCNEELENLKRNAFSLQPLKDIALQWHHGDSMLQLSMRSTATIQEHSFDGFEKWDVGDF